MNSLFKQYEGIFEEKTETAEKKKAGFQYEYSPFALQDALGSKNPKATWIEYVKLRFAGVEPESIVSNLISKIRDMLGASLGLTQNDLSIKNPFPYNKSKKDSKNWKREELERIYNNLVSAYHQSRITGADLETEVEKTILSL